MSLLKAVTLVVGCMFAMPAPAAKESWRMLLADAEDGHSLAITSFACAITPNDKTMRLAAIRYNDNERPIEHGCWTIEPSDPDTVVLRFLASDARKVPITKFRVVK